MTKYDYGILDATLYIITYGIGKFLSNILPDNAILDLYGDLD